jgi:hypothetical protein
MFGRPVGHRAMVDDDTHAEWVERMVVVGQDADGGGL